MFTSVRFSSGCLNTRREVVDALDIIGAAHHFKVPLEIEPAVWRVLERAIVEIEPIDIDDSASWHFVDSQANKKATPQGRPTGSEIRGVVYEL
jgi:hypothetical protein